MRRQQRGKEEMQEEAGGVKKGKKKADTED